MAWHPQTGHRDKPYVPFAWGRESKQQEATSGASPTSTSLLTKVNFFFLLVFNIRGCVEEVAQIQSARGK